MSGKRIYFDNAATTPLNSKVAGVMREFEDVYYGNPNSIHYEGQQARAKIDFARAEIASAIFAQPQEIVFTSGATEANNMVIKGVVSLALPTLYDKPHIITTSLEHQSVYNVVRELEAQGIVEATYIKPDKNGLIKTVDVIKAIQDNTVLISTIFVSNEIGSVLPVREIGRELAAINAKQSNKIYFHTDAVQAFKYYNCHVEKLGVDFMTLSAHKLNGPKGIGALYIKSGVKLANLLHGGSQEYGKRPGTQNTSGIIGFAKAVSLCGDFESRHKAGEAIRKLSDELTTAVKKNKSCELNGPVGSNRAPDNVNFTIKNVDQDTVIAKLDMLGFAVSTGSACVSGSTEPSHVIESLGKKYKDPSATVRVSLGKQNTLTEIKSFIKALAKITTAPK